MVKPDIYIQPAENKFIEIVRLIWIIGTVGAFVAAGLIISAGEWLTGKE